jgi:uncharacterized membrane protein (UPF0127 family)
VIAACSPQTPTAAEIRAGAQSGLATAPLTIHSSHGDHRFTVEIARTAEQQMTGLMFRRALPANHGMIFPSDRPIMASFWMHNTLIPLDIIFVRADGTIARITTAKPLDDSPVPAGEPVVAVLELRGGRASELGIRAGDRVDWSH